VLKENKSLHKVFFNNILFVEACGDYVKVHTDSKTVMTNMTFKNLNNSLPNNFFQVHKSYTINVHKLQQVSGNLIFIDSHKIPIGQTYKKAVMENLF
jgi:DNA-binding LytR/AlgR family response regulator